MEQVRFTDLAGLQAKQKTAWYTLLNPECKYLLYGGSMAGGKSYLLRWAAVGYAMYLYGKYNIKYIPIGLFSEDYPTLKDRQISRIVREFPPFLGELKETKEEGMAFFLKEEFGAGRILLRNLDDPSKYMSSEFAGIFVEELTRNDRQTFEDLRNRLRYPHVEEVKFMGASNPGGIGHGWVKEFFVDKLNSDPENDRFFYVHANAYDNKYISETYIKQLESLPEQKRKAYLLGSWDIFAGQIFVEFIREKHVVPPFIPKENTIIVAGMDWGYAAPAVLLLGVFKEIQMENGIKFSRLYIFKEIDGTERTPKQWSEIYKKNKELLRAKIYADPAMFNKLQDSSFSIANQFQREGILLHKSTNNALNKIINIHNWLSLAPDGYPYIVFTETCQHTIKTIPEAMYDDLDPEDKDRNWQEDHWYDALSYMLAMLKWVDAGKVGGIGRTGVKTPIKRTAVIDPKTGKQISIDLDKWGTDKRKKDKPYYPR